MKLGQQVVWGKGNGTYPQNFYESSIRIPFILFDPRNNKSKINNETYGQYDTFPTILDLCSIKFKYDASFPGNSIYSKSDILLVDEKNIFYEYGPNRMIRTEKYKLISRYKENESELYNLESDTLESKKLIELEEVGEIQNRLNNKLNGWFNHYAIQELDGIYSDCDGVGWIVK